jgi:hypothetical protein
VKDADFVCTLKVTQAEKDVKSFMNKMLISFRFREEEKNGLPGRARSAIL